MIILGIDPGLATMGYGVINSEKGNYSVIDYGVVTTPKECTLPERLLQLEDGVKELIDTYKPDNVSIEELFFQKHNHGHSRRGGKRRDFAHGGEEPWQRGVRIHAQPNQASGYGLRRSGQNPNATYGAGFVAPEKRTAPRRCRRRFGGCDMPRANKQTDRHFQGAVNIT